MFLSTGILVYQHSDFACTLSHLFPMKNTDKEASVRRWKKNIFSHLLVFEYLNLYLHLYIKIEHSRSTPSLNAAAAAEFRTRSLFFHCSKSAKEAPPPPVLLPVGGRPSSSAPTHSRPLSPPASFLSHPHAPHLVDPLPPHFFRSLTYNFSPS